MEKAERERAERYQRKLEREIAQEDEARARVALVDPPPGFVTGRKAASVKSQERLDRLEAKQRTRRTDRQMLAPPAEARNPGAESAQGPVEAAENQKSRRGTRPARQGVPGPSLTARREARKAHRRHRGEVQRRGRTGTREAMAELGTEHRELTEKLTALLLSLRADETTEQRLQTVGLV